MEKKYVIQCRINTIDSNGKISRGQWMKWKKYKTLDALLNAWDYLKKIKNKDNLDKANDKIECKLIWQYRAINLSDEKK